MGLFSSIGKIAGGFFGGSTGAAIGGTIGGLVDGKREKRASTQTSRVNFQQLRDDAEAAGFNPLTALQATGGQGNVTTSTPSLSSGEFIAGALTRGFDAWSNAKQEALDVTEQNLRIQAYEQEIAENAQKMSRTRDAVTPLGSSIPMYDATNQTLGGRTAVKTAPAFSFGSDLPASGKLYGLGGASITGRTSSADEYAERYGDVVGEVAGVGNLISDAFYRMTDPMGERFNSPKVRPKRRPIPRTGTPKAPAMSRMGEFPGAW